MSFVCGSVDSGRSISDIRLEASEQVVHPGVAMIFALRAVCGNIAERKPDNQGRIELDKSDRRL